MANYQEEMLEEMTYFTRMLDGKGRVNTTNTSKFRGLDAKCDLVIEKDGIKMNKEQFLNEVRREVGAPTIRTKASRTRKMGKRALGGLFVIAIAVSIVSAGLLLMFGSMKQDITTQASITLDGVGTGELQILTPIASAFGGDIIKTYHTLESHSDSFIMVDMTQAILEGDPGVPITQNEIISQIMTEIGATGTMVFGTGNNILTRQANTVDYQWQQATVGAQFRSCEILLKQNNENWIKINVSAMNGVINSAHYYDWELTGWSASHTLPIDGTHDPTSGIAVWGTGDAHLYISILYGNMPAQFSWSGLWTNNAGTPLTVPETEDGVTYTEITFPYLMSPHESLEFLWRIALDPLISPDDYSVQIDFLPGT